jgi:hypothetical protein
MTVLGVIADTHIPDRVRHLNPAILPIFRDAGVEAILHAGDISGPDVLRMLEEVAPVYAVQGNRDWLLLRHLPHNQVLTFEGVNLILDHGHGVWQDYVVDKFHYMFYGMQERRYQNRLLAKYPQAQVIVYGHLHIPCNTWFGDVFLFNPGSASVPTKKYTPSVGILKIRAGGKFAGKIIEMS